MGRKWAKIGAKMLGYKVEENVNGTDMFPLLAQKPYRIYLFGGAPGVAATALEKAKKLNGKAEFVGCADGFFKEKSEDEVLAAHIHAGADAVFPIVRSHGFKTIHGETDFTVTQHEVTCEVHLPRGIIHQQLTTVQGEGRESATALHDAAVHHNSISAGDGAVIVDQGTSGFHLHRLRVVGGIGNRQRSAGVNRGFTGNGSLHVLDRQLGSIQLNRIGLDC